MGKIPILVRIDEELVEELKILVITKYRKLKGGLSLEVEEAIKHWLSLQKENPGLNELFNTHTHMHKNFQKQDSYEDKVRQKILSIIKNLHELGIENEFTVAHWQTACYKAGYSDVRTIKKYLEIAEKMGMIQFVRLGIFKLNYTFNT
jgi:hypothetical protein